MKKEKQDKSYSDSVKTLFDKVGEDHSNLDYNFPDGTYYRFDFKKHLAKWGSAELISN